MDGGRRYLLNSAVLTAFGRWEYLPLTSAEAEMWLDRCVRCGHTEEFHRHRTEEMVLEDDERDCPGFTGPTSTIGYQETATALEQFCGLPTGAIPVNRQTISMATGDEALVFRLVFPSGIRPDAAMKGGLGLEFLRAHSECGLLRRLA